MILISKNPTLQQIAATAPADWLRVPWSTPLDNAPVVALCEEWGFELLPRKKTVCVFMDSVRQPPGKLQSLGNPVITIDAPQPGCYFLFTPVDVSRFKPLPWKDRKKIICPIRINGYTDRKAAVCTLERMGVEIIERDDSRPYQDYIDTLCSAKAVVNFCLDRKTSMPQMKGRVLETLAAGALLLEQRNPVTSKWLEGSEYLAWDDFDELESHIKNLTRAPSVEKHIAANGHELVSACMNARAFWREVVRELEQ
jgi:hypothetical protein